MTRRRLLVADKVGLGKTIETNLLDDHLFDSPQALLQHRSLLKRVMIRRTKREVTDAQGNALFVRRQVHTESFEPALREQRFYEQLTEMMRQAQDARDALAQLSQDLTHFNLDHYRKITGQFQLSQLGCWCREAVIRLGGSVLPAGDFWRFGTPDCLKGYSQINAQYDMVTFDRALATRTKKCEIFGIGHPLVDALLTYLQNAPFEADTAVLSTAGGKADVVEARYRVTWHRPEQPPSSSVVRVSLNGTATVDEVSLDPERLISSSHPQCGMVGIVKSEASAEEAIRMWIASRRTEMPHGTIARCELLGLSWGGA